jgi:hypothetical protein
VGGGPAGARRGCVLCGAALGNLNSSNGFAKQLMGPLHGVWSTLRGPSVSPTVKVPQKPGANAYVGCKITVARGSRSDPAAHHQLELNNDSIVQYPTDLPILLKIM